MLSVPARWSSLYFDIFFILCAAGVIFVLCYGVLRPPQNADAWDIAANILHRLAAVPVVAALLAFIIMKVRDFAMKTWETFKRERFDSGVELGMEKGREEGIEIGTQRAIREIRERLAEREASRRGERDDWLDEILSELSQNGSREK